MAAGLAAVVIGIASWSSLNDRAVAAERVSHALDLIAQAQATLSSLKDAETGQRGFLLTGSERYLEPYTATRERLATTLLRLRELSGSDPRQQQRLDALGNATAEKMDELTKTIQLRREGKTDEALAIVVTDQGKLAMDRIRVAIESIVRDANTELAAAQTEWQDTVRTSTLITSGGSSILMVLNVMAAAIMSRDHRARKRQEWIRDGQVGLCKGDRRRKQIRRAGRRDLGLPGRLSPGPGGRAARSATTTADCVASRATPSRRRARSTRTCCPGAISWPKRQRTTGRCA